MDSKGQSSNLGTHMNINQAIIDVKRASKQWDAAYIAAATPQARESKYFDIGFGGFYETDEHLALLKTHGFNSFEDYDAAYEKADCVVAYNKFNHIMGLEGVTFDALSKELKALGLYNENTGVESGIELYEVAKKHFPRHAALVDLMEELGYEFPTFGFKIKE